MITKVKVMVSKIMFEKNCKLHMYYVYLPMYLKLVANIT